MSLRLLILFLSLLLVLTTISSSTVVEVDADITGHTTTTTTSTSNDDDNSQVSDRTDMFCSADKGYTYNNLAHVVPASITFQRYLKDKCGIELQPNACYPSQVSTLHFAISSQLNANFEQAQLQHCGDVAKTDVISSLDDFGSILSNDAVDFVLHQYVWQRMINPLAALEEWVRVTVADGFIAFIVPRRSRVTLSNPFHDVPSPSSRVTTMKDLEDIYDGVTSSVTEMHVFTPKLIIDILQWYNRKHRVEKTSLVNVVFFVHDDRDGKGHLGIWQVIKNDTREDDNVFH